MKKVFLMVAIVATVGFTACGGSDDEKAGTDICDCVELEEKADKMRTDGKSKEEVEKELASEIEACEELEKKFKDASKEEKKALREEAKACEK